MTAWVRLCCLVAVATAGLQGVGAQRAPMTFFITSTRLGDGGNLGGLAAADQHCQSLAQAAGAGAFTWRAYLSTQASGGPPAVNARDRIGRGPWHNAAGVRIAADVADLHSSANNLTKATQLSERGDVVKGMGNTPVEHDIITGTLIDGTAPSGTDDLTCRNWTSNSDGRALVGHHDREGGGPNPTSWNSAHASRGCSADALRGSGAAGYFYCFAVR